MRRGQRPNLTIEETDLGEPQQQNGHNEQRSEQMISVNDTSYGRGRVRRLEGSDVTALNTPTDGRPSDLNGRPTKRGRLGGKDA